VEQYLHAPYMPLWYGQEQLCLYFFWAIIIVWAGELNFCQECVNVRAIEICEISKSTFWKYLENTFLCLFLLAFQTSLSWRVCLMEKGYKCKYFSVCMFLHDQFNYKNCCVGVQVHAHVWNIHEVSHSPWNVRAVFKFMSSNLFLSTGNVRISSYGQLYWFVFLLTHLILFFIVAPCILKSI
jgi:hypothetical protein